MVRGICAGDAKEISAAAFILGPLFKMEQVDGGVLKSILKKQLGISNLDKETKQAKKANKEKDLVKKARMEKWAVWSLEGGLQTLIEALKLHLLNNGVEIRTGTLTKELIFDKDNSSIRLLGSDFEIECEHCFLGLPAYSAAKLFETSENAHLQELLLSIPYVDVAVVNVEYDGKLSLPTGEAFGVLVPSNQEHIPILGIIFDTCSFPQSTSENLEKSIFTVMMGGKWFDNLFGSSPEMELLENLATEQIQNILNIHQKPSRVVAKIHRKSIAQYTVGHGQRTENLRRHVKKENLPLSFIGSAFDGVGINDAIQSARKHVQCL